MTSAEEMASIIATSMECKMRRHGREWRVLCPAHEADGGDHSPSLAIWDKPDGGHAMKCMTGCEKKAIVAALKARGVSMPKAPALTPEQKLEQVAKREQERINKITAARDIFEFSEEVRCNDAIHQYFYGRGLLVPTEARRVDDPLYPGFPALLMPIVDLTTLRDAEPLATGVLTLSLYADGRPRIDRHGHKLRSVHGVQKGCAVAMGFPGSRLVVAEGVESAAAAMSLLGIPFGAATLSSSNMKPLRIPPWVREVVIAADNDEPGVKAAEGLAKSLHKLVPVTTKLWGLPNTGWDANDELRRTRGL